MNDTVRQAIVSWLDSVEPEHRPAVRRFPLRSGRSATDPILKAALASAKQARQREVEARRLARTRRMVVEAAL